MTASRALTLSAATALAGALTSGPGAIALVQYTHPQPAWRDAEAFVRAFHPVQTIPYVAGLLLVGGFVSVIASLASLGGDGRRARLTCAVVCVSIFATLIVVNYAVQTTVIPPLVAAWRPDAAAVLSTLTMSNPVSLGWALEMWGYGALGAATWLVAPVLRARPGGGVAAALFVANGVVSVAGTIITVLRPGWVMTPAGLMSFALWNLLVIVMLATAIAAVRKEGV
jgi:hypothetical protein